MYKINYLIMLFIFIYSSVIFGQNKGQAIQIYKEITRQDVTGKSVEEVKKLFTDFTKENIQQLQIARSTNPTAESLRINDQWNDLKQALEILEMTSEKSCTAIVTPTKPTISKEEIIVQRNLTEKDEILNEDYSLMTQAGGSISKISLSGLVERIGEIISLSLCKDRAFTIIPNIGEDGQRALGYILLTHKR